MVSGGLASDAEAAERIRPQAQEAHQRASQAVRERQADRDQALALAAVDAATLLTSRLWISQLTAALETQAILAGLAEELRRRGQDAAATQIVELIRETRASITTPANTIPGRRLLDALSSDARALLEPST
jgi:hypothetical protein